MHIKFEFESFTALLEEKIFEESGIQFTYKFINTYIPKTRVYSSPYGWIEVSFISFGKESTEDVKSLFFNRLAKRFYFQLKEVNKSQTRNYELSKADLYKIPEGVLICLKQTLEKRKNAFVLSIDIKELSGFDIKKYSANPNIKSKFRHLSR